MIENGDRAPGFVLPEAPGSMVDVGERIGQRPVVLLFFPLAYSGVCTTEMCKIRDDWSGWGELDADVYAISVDSPFVTQKWRADLNLPFPVLADFNKDVIRQYGVVHEDLMGLKGIAKRSVFVIARDGSVVYKWVSEDPGVEPDYAAVKGALQSDS